jgi:hypothetical protein
LSGTVCLDQLVSHVQNGNKYLQGLEEIMLSGKISSVFSTEKSLGILKSDLLHVAILVLGAAESW